MQISHGDLKLANTLLDGSPAPRLKICDFGYSVSSLLHSKPKSITGTLRYIAPEVLSGTEYEGKLSDIWSCGVTLYVMLVGAYPFENKKEPENIEKTTQGYIWEKEKNDDDQVKVELDVEEEEVEEEDELEVAEEKGYDKKVKEVYKSEGLSLSGLVRWPERSLVLNQFCSNHTDPSPLAATIYDPSTFGLHLDSAVSQSLSQSITYRSELSYPSISNARSYEKSIKSNVSHPSESSEYQMQSPNSASELSDAKIWERVTNFDPSISDVREAEKSIIIEQLQSYKNTSASKLHDSGIAEGSLDSKVLDSEYSAKIENLDLSLSDVRSAKKSVVFSSHFNWRGWMGKGRAK
ncbi:hypothetical protein POM88_048305 [Heracleum sosnowskyi]|uniref:non-specific serine/threonine protein kinase n=1 Tax=Heracleum sosnowskyi TaxID=360622 RepID=A0AAD8GVM7_9APIA|nr:hypothetical protein POM88_048305 [Heracleum sosnowskyi]